MPALNIMSLWDHAPEFQRQQEGSLMHARTICIYNTLRQHDDRPFSYFEMTSWRKARKKDKLTTRDNTLSRWTDYARYLLYRSRSLPIERTIISSISISTHTHRYRYMYTLLQCKGRKKSSNRNQRHARKSAWNRRSILSYRDHALTFSNTIYIYVARVRIPSFFALLSITHKSGAITFHF